MVETTPISPILGARITGLDIARGVDPATMAALRDALDRFSVLVFPDQRIDDAAQIAFSEGFGPLELNPICLDHTLLRRTCSGTLLA